MILTSPHPPDELLGDPVYPRLKEYLIEATGLAYYADKDADLARRIRRRLSGFGFEDCASYLDLLRDPARGAPEMDALVEEVTIGETYFFRHQEHFNALRDLVLPDLIARNAGQRRLRIWCAGCADGAEPYSLSILLRRELAQVLWGWDVSILGTDINRQCLATAREGRYEQWSLRSTPENMKQACFEESGKTWTIVPEYKAGLSFQFHNLVEDAFPPLGEPSAFDLIICRNVMIYFAPNLMRRIVRRFHDCLAPGGWLLVGPSEPNMTHFTSFLAVNAPGVTLYQRPDPSAPDVPDDISFPAVLPRAEVQPGRRNLRPAWRQPATSSLPRSPIFAEAPTRAIGRMQPDAARSCSSLTTSMPWLTFTMLWCWSKWETPPKRSGHFERRFTWIAGLCSRTTTSDCFCDRTGTRARQSAASTTLWIFSRPWRPAKS